MIGRQLQKGWTASKALCPVGKLLLALFAFNPLALPVDKVHKLHWQFGQWGGLVCGKCLIKKKKLMQKCVERPAIMHQVMLDVCQEILLVAQVQQRPADQRKLIKGKWPTELLLEIAPDKLCLFGCGYCIQVNNRQLHWPGIMNELHGLPVESLKGRAKHFMAPDNLTQTLFQGCDVQGSLDFKRGLEVVGDILWSELQDKPDLFLRKRKWMISTVARSR